MRRSIRRKAWRDVRALCASYLVVVPVLEILGSGLGAATLPIACLGLCAQLAVCLGGEEPLAGTRDLLRTRAIDPRLHATLRFALGLGLLGAFVLWCLLVHAIRPGHLFWGAFGIEPMDEEISLPVGAVAQGLAALVLAYAASFAAARECRRAATVFPAVWGAVAGVAVGLGMAWTWRIYLSQPRTIQAVVLDAPFVAAATAAMLALAAIAFALARRRAGVRP